MARSCADNCVSHTQASTTNAVCINQIQTSQHTTTCALTNWFTYQHPDQCLKPIALNYILQLLQMLVASAHLLVCIIYIMYPERPHSNGKPSHHNRKHQCSIQRCPSLPARTFAADLQIAGQLSKLPVTSMYAGCDAAAIHINHSTVASTMHLQQLPGFKLLQQ